MVNNASTATRLEAFFYAGLLQAVRQNFPRKGVIHIMRLLEKRILEDGCVINNEVLNVDRIFSQQVDTGLLVEIGKEFESRFGNKNIDRILTVETAGIPIAMTTASYLHVPFVYARKQAIPILEGSKLSIAAYSCSQSQHYHMYLLKHLLPEGERVLILDDILSNGEAILGLIKMCRQAGATVAGIGVAIEKAFRPGREKIRQEGYDVTALTRIERFEGGKPVFLR